MKQAIHLIDPVKAESNNSRYVTARCGMMTLPKSIMLTKKNSEVTCLKCRSYINNPYRTMRKYGKVKVVESFFVVLWSDYGYRFDMVATIDAPGMWSVIISEKSQIHFTRVIVATNMADLGYQLLEIIEKEIIDLAKTYQQNVTL